MNKPSGDAERFKTVNGLLWPADDVECARVVFDSIPDLMRAVGFCAQRRTVIQAGGNCGVWARHLSGQFDSVWAWEPDRLNFECFRSNTLGFFNITGVNAGLGSAPGMATMDKLDGNCGAHQIGVPIQGKDWSLSAVVIDVLDDVKETLLGDVDLIYLDVEGYELAALQGAEQTIMRCRPIIAVEDKGLSERYGVAQGEVVEWVCKNLRYEVCDRYARDVVMRPLP